MVIFLHMSDIIFILIATYTIPYIYTYLHCILLSILALLLLLTLFLLRGSPMSISLMGSFWASSPLSFAFV